MPKVNGLTQKEIKLIRGILEGKTKRQAALEAYNAKTPETASAMASETLSKPNVQEALQLALSKQGITIEKVVEPVTKALNATVKIRTQDGVVVDTEEPDLEMQLKGHDRAMKILNVNQAKDGSTNANFIQVNNNYGDRYQD